MHIHKIYINIYLSMGCRGDLYTICVSINNVQYGHGMYSRYRGRAAVTKRKEKRRNKDKVLRTKID